MQTMKTLIGRRMLNIEELMYFEKNIFNIFPYNCLRQMRSKFDPAMKMSKFNLGSSFEQTWLTSHALCYIPRLPGSSDFKGFYHIWAWETSWSMDHDQLN